MILFLRNDNLVRLKDFENKSVDPAVPFDLATVTAELLDPDDLDGTPLVVPQTLAKEPSVAGTYSAVWDKGLLSPGGNDLAEGEYVLRYKASEGTADLEKDVFIEVRLRSEDIND